MEKQYYLLFQMLIRFCLMPCRLHGNVESLGVLPNGATDGGKRRDSIILTFRDAKISVLEFDESIYGLRTRCDVILLLQIPIPQFEGTQHILWCYWWHSYSHMHI